jgi:hypothetical protein
MTLAVGIAALAMSGACGSNDPGPNAAGSNPMGSLFEPKSDTEVTELVAMFDPPEADAVAERSALESVESLSDFTTSQQVLLSLAPTPAAFGEFRLANLQVDDPNGDGTIAGRWYPPRVLRQDCNTKVDLPSGPFVIASYLPSKTPTPFTAADPMVGFELMRSPVAIGVQVQVFDEETQRDGARDAMLEFLRSPTLTCGGSEMPGLAEYVEFPIPASTGQGVAFEIKSPLAPTPSIQVLYAVGDRVLLTLSVATQAAKDGWSAEMIFKWLQPVEAAVIARLAEAELPSL